MKRPEKPLRGKSRALVLFVAKAGPARGAAHCEAAFVQRAEAVDFLSRLHGLTAQEARELAREGQLRLDRRWHGAESCRIMEVRMEPEAARQALSGELYLCA